MILEIRSAEQGAWKSLFIRKNVINLGKGSNLKSAHPLTLEWYEPVKQAIMQEQQVTFVCIILLLIIKFFIFCLPLF